MNRLSFISIVLLAMAFSQEIDTSLVNNEEVLNVNQWQRIFEGIESNPFNEFKLKNNIYTFIK